MEKAKWTQIGQSAMERLDLPGDLAGAPRLELIGNRQLLLVRHRGVLAYSPASVEISTGTLTVRVSGENLQLTAMTDSELRLDGILAKVELMP